MVINKEPLRACEEAPVLINYTRAAQSFVLDVVPRARVRLFGLPRKKTPPRFSRSPPRRTHAGRSVAPFAIPSRRLSPPWTSSAAPRAPRSPPRPRSRSDSPRSPRVPEPPSSPRPRHHPQRPQRPRLARAAPSPRRPRVRSPSPPHSAVRTSRVRPRAAARNRTPTRTRTRIVVLQRRPRPWTPRLIRPRRLERIAKFSRLLRRRAHGSLQLRDARLVPRVRLAQQRVLRLIVFEFGPEHVARLALSRVRPVLALAPARLRTRRGRERRGSIGTVRTVRGGGCPWIARGGGGGRADAGARARAAVLGGFARVRSRSRAIGKRPRFRRGTLRALPAGPAIGPGSTAPRCGVFVDGLDEQVALDGVATRGGFRVGGATRVAASGGDASRDPGWLAACIVGETRAAAFVTASSCSNAWMRSCRSRGGLRGEGGVRGGERCAGERK